MKKQRIAIQRDTESYIAKNKAKFKAIITKYNNNEPQCTIKGSKKTIIETLPLDTLEATLLLKNTYPNEKVGFLVMANATNKGGGYKDGSPSQEESICRRTDLTDCFNRMTYPIPEFGSFHISNLSIFRDTEKNNYAYIQPVKCDAVLSAAYHGPPIDTNGKLADGFRNKTKIKIRMMLNAFLKNNNYNIVLGAYGCGAFQNPVEDIAMIFQELLEGEFKDVFNHIIFAVLKDVGHANYNIFVNHFSKKT